jgi:hypothetical protein
MGIPDRWLEPSPPLPVDDLDGGFPMLAAEQCVERGDRDGLASEVSLSPTAEPSGSTLEP